MRDEVMTIAEQYRVARVEAIAEVGAEVQARLDAPPVLVIKVRLASRPLLFDVDDAERWG